MSESEDLVVDGTRVRFVRIDGDELRVLVEQAEVGSLEPAGVGGGYVARRPDGEALTRPSQWGGRVSARFGSKEMAVRALLGLR